MKDVVNTARAAEILGCSRPRVIQLIHEGVIQSAYMAPPDGFRGKSGFRISVDELYRLAEERSSRKSTKNEKVVDTQVVPSYNTEAIKNALGEIQICLIMLNDSIEKLKGEL